VDPLIGGVVDGRFTILSRLGAGGAGVVYAAQQESLGRKVALKVLAPEATHDPVAEQRFRTEARAACRLTSLHAVHIHEFGTTQEGLLYIAMELLEGESLRTRLGRGRLPVRDAVIIGLHIADALAEAHALNPQVVHRDIKPDNVIVRPTPEGDPFAVVLDFGLARFENDERLTATNTVIGTVAYMAPEQAVAEGAIGDRTDVYGLGVTLFEMLTGETPFTSESQVAMLHKHVYERAPRVRRYLPDVTHPLDVLVQQMLEKSPEARPAASQVRTRLLAILETLPRAAQVITAPSPSVVSESTPEGTRRPATGVAPQTTTKPASRRSSKVVRTVVELVAAVLIVGAALIAREHLVAAPLPDTEAPFVADDTARPPAVTPTPPVVKHDVVVPHVSGPDDVVRGEQAWELGPGHNKPPAQPRPAADSAPPSKATDHRKHHRKSGTHADDAE
jgi:serine/threonine-protein kinase